MKCEYCHKEFKPRTATQRFDKQECRVAQWRLEKKNGKKKPNVKKPALHQGKVAVPVSEHVEAMLTKSQFDTLMTSGMQEALPFVASVLKRALADPDTPANALAPISREYLTTIEKIDAQSSTNPVFSLDKLPSQETNVDMSQI